MYISLLLLRYFVINRTGQINQASLRMCLINPLFLNHSVAFFMKVAVAHTIGHVAATVSMSKVAVSFTHIIKSGEPAFSVLVSRFILGESFPTSVYLSLLPIIGGCALAAVTELNFDMIGNYTLFCFSTIQSSLGS